MEVAEARRTVESTAQRSWRRGTDFLEVVLADEDVLGRLSTARIEEIGDEVLASSRAGVSLDPAGQDWFRAAAAGQPVVTSVMQRGDHLQWVIAQPVVGGNGRPQGVVVGDLNPGALAGLLNAELDEGSEVVDICVVVRERRSVWNWHAGKVAGCPTGWVNPPQTPSPG